MDFKQIQDLIKLVNRSELSEFRMEQGDLKLTIRTKHYNSGTTQVVQAAPTVATAAPAPVASAPAPATNEAAPAKKAEEAADEENSKYITVKSPMIGTFYRASGPEKEPFVKVGDNVDKGTVVCIIEAMKLFNEIESEVSGKIVKVLADDASPVEYDQPLFIVDPS